MTSWSPVSVSLAVNARCDAAPATATVTSSSSTAESTASAAVDRRMVIRGSSLVDGCTDGRAASPQRVFIRRRLRARLPSVPMSLRRARLAPICLALLLLLTACLSDQPNPSPSSDRPDREPDGRPHRRLRSRRRRRSPRSTCRSRSSPATPPRVRTSRWPKSRQRSTRILAPCEVTAVLDRTLDGDRDCLRAHRVVRAAHGRARRPWP